MKLISSVVVVFSAVLLISSIEASSWLGYLFGCGSSAKAADPADEPSLKAVDESKTKEQPPVKPRRYVDVLMNRAATEVPPAPSSEATMDLDADEQQVLGDQQAEESPADEEFQLVQSTEETVEPSLQQLQEEGNLNRRGTSFFDYVEGVEREMETSNSFVAPGMGRKKRHRHRRGTKHQVASGL